MNKLKTERGNSLKYLYAFDLSMSCTGLVIFNIDTYESLLITSFSTKDNDTHGVRLNQIKEGISELLDKYPPCEVAIERGFSRFNLSTQVSYRVHGVINELFKDYKQTYYPPKKVKEAILKGTATKKQLQDKIIKVYPDLEFTNEDQSDAFAVGITHLINKYKMKWVK